MRIILAFSYLIALVMGQTEATLTQPRYLQTSTIQIINSNTSATNLTTNVTLMQNYNTQPAVFVSLATISKFTPLSLSTLEQSVLTVTNTHFVHFTNFAMSISSIKYYFTKLEIIYLAYDYSYYSFLQFHDSFVPIPVTVLNNIYLKIGYISYSVTNTTNTTNTTDTTNSTNTTSQANSSNNNAHNSIPNLPTAPIITPIITPAPSITPALNSSHNYSLNVILSGFNGLVLLGNPTLYIDCVQYDDNNYLLNVKFKNLEVLQLQILRILIDLTQMQSAVTGPSSLICTSGTIMHLSDPNAIQSNDSPEFLPFAMLYGIKGWVGLNFSLTSFVYLFNNTRPKAQLSIGYVLFQTSSCPTNYLYVASQNLCYTRSVAFYYQLTPQTMAPCPVECYTCVGPLSTQCASCVQGWNRHYVSGRCLCITGFYSSGGPICKNCTEAIAGCYTCSSATNCLSCLSGCTAISFNPIYCDCPNHVQTNYSYNCPANYYYQYDKNECQCRPRTFEYRPGICFPCEIGCYICVGSAKYCLVCINAFTLVNNTCIYFTKNYALLGQGVGLSSPYNRCLKWDNSGSNCLQKCKKYYYNSNCYGVCPMGTFNISSPWLTCQPCKLTCKMCFNFTVCLFCQPNYFYFNTSTFGCSPCSQFCVTCLNDSYCTSCENNYNLANNSCTPTSLALLNCSVSCAYCVIDDWCLACIPTFYLNITDHSCYSCDTNPNFAITGSGSCIQICGDGVVVFAACDDGNLNSGDGCSSTCQIQQGFLCQLVDHKSYCWNFDTRINWQIIPIFGMNRFSLIVGSSRNWSASILKLSCSFANEIVESKKQEWKASWVINYKQTVLMTQNKNDEQNVKNLAGFDTANRCYLDIDGILNYTIVINPSPELLFINYQDTLQSYTQNNLFQIICEISLLTMLSIGLLGLMPLNIFAGLRVFLLALSTYLDYYKLPINSFKTLNALMNLLLMRDAGDSANFITFKSDFYFQIFWRMSTVYVGVFLFHDWVLRGAFKFFKSMNLKYLTRMVQNIQDNKIVIYQTIYTSYQAVLLTLLCNAFRNIGQTDAKLIFFMAVHTLFFCLTKAHFYFTLPSLFQNNCSIRYSLISDQFQNITIVFLSELSDANVSYAPIAITLFSAYNLYSLINFQDEPDGKDKNAYQFRVTNNIAVWQYGLNLIIIMAVQILKCANMWRGVANLSLQGYQSLGSLLGIGISFTVIGLIIINSFMTLLCLLIRLCELKDDKGEVGQEETIDNISAEASVVE